MPYSSTYAAVLVMLVGAVGLKLSNDEAETFVTVFITLLSAFHLLWKRFQRGGIHWSGLKH
jgi:hypothetical protein